MTIYTVIGINASDPADVNAFDCIVAGSFPTREAAENRVWEEQVKSGYYVWVIRENTVVN